MVKIAQNWLAKLRNSHFVITGGGGGGGPHCIHPYPGLGSMCVAALGETLVFWGWGVYGGRLCEGWERRVAVLVLGAGGDCWREAVLLQRSAAATDQCIAQQNRVFTSVAGKRLSSWQMMWSPV